MRRTAGVLMLILGVIVLVDAGVLANSGEMVDAVSVHRSAVSAHRSRLFLAFLGFQAVCGLLQLGAGYALVRGRYVGIVSWGGLSAIALGAVIWRRINVPLAVLPLYPVSMICVGIMALVAGRRRPVGEKGGPSTRPGSPVAADQQVVHQSSAAMAPSRDLLMLGWVLAWCVALFGVGYLVTMQFDSPSAGAVIWILGTFAAGILGKRYADRRDAIRSVGRETEQQAQLPTTNDAENIRVAEEELESCEDRTNERRRRMDYSVRFGSAFATDQFGFVRAGKVAVEESTVTFTGKKSWSAAAKVGVFLLITVVPLILFRFGLGFLLALVVIHYLCASDGSITIQRASISGVQRKGRQIRFTGAHPETGKTKRSIFKADTEENAVRLEQELTAG